MPSNIEIKARLTDLAAARRIAREASDTPVEVLEQVDTFFNTPHGRLKLREFPDGRGELIHYERPNEIGPKDCRYTIFRTGSPALLKQALTEGLGVRGIVRKRRELYLIGQTRVHLDEVDGLGTFLEFEVVMREGQDADSGRQIAKDLLQRFGITEAHQIAGAYIDLIEQA